MGAAMAVLGTIATVLLVISDGVGETTSSYTFEVYKPLESFEFART